MMNNAIKRRLVTPTDMPTINPRDKDAGVGKNNSSWLYIISKLNDAEN